MDLVGTLTRCLYSRDALVVGSMTTLAWCCPCRFSPSNEIWCVVGSNLVPWCAYALILYRCVAHGRSYLFPVYWPRRSYFTSSFSFWYFCSCCRWWWICLDGSAMFLISFLIFFIWIHPWRCVCLIFHPWKFRALFFRGFGGSAYLFESWIFA